MLWNEVIYPFKFKVISLWIVMMKRDCDYCEDEICIKSYGKLGFGHKVHE